QSAANKVGMSGSAFGCDPTATEPATMTCIGTAITKANASIDKACFTAPATHPSCYDGSGLRPNTAAGWTALAEASVDATTRKVFCKTTATTTTTSTTTTTTTMGPMTFTVQVGLNGTLTYTPSTLMIHAGDTVQWVFATGPHTVTSGTNCVADANPLLDSTTDFQHTFTTPGVYPYFCTIPGHCAVGMTGSITVLQ